MDQIDAWIRFQDVAPCPLARMGLAGYQQHAQSIADAVDDQGGSIVGQGQFLFGRGDLKLDDRRAAMVKVEGHLEVLPDRDLKGQRIAAILARCHGDQTASAAHRQIVDPDCRGDLAADQPESRHLDHRQPTIGFAPVPGQQCVNRAGALQRACVERSVVDLSVGQQDRAGNAAPRHIGEGRIQRVEQAGLAKLAVGVDPGPHDAQVDNCPSATDWR